MEEAVLDKKYTDFIEDLINQVSSVVPDDVNELQKNYLITNMRKSTILLANSMQETEEFSQLTFDNQCFYIQIMAEWSFHKEIDLFRSGIPAKYWKCVMQKIWYAMWEVMYACAKNDAPETVVLSLIERFVNRTYNDAIDELKEESIIDEATEVLAKEQSNIEKMAQELRLEKKITNDIKNIIKRTIGALLIAAIVSVMIIKFKMVGLVIILTILLVYQFIPTKNN